MSWDKFVQWWNNIASQVGDWFLKEDESGLNPLSRLFIAVAVFIIGRILVKLFMKLLRRIFGVKSKVGVDVSVKTFTLSLLNVVLNILLLILVLWIIKIDLSSFASVLSAVTVAIGLSLQDLISSFAAGLVLLKNKNFKTGDYINIVHDMGTCEGTVSSVGLITTTLVTFDNHKIIVPNNKLSQSVITNITTTPTRRLALNFSVDYNTDTEKAKQVISSLMEEDKRILSAPKPSVVVSDLAEFSITITAKCFIRQENYWDVKFDLTEKVLLAFRANHILIPYKRMVVENYNMKEPTTPSIDVHE